MLLSSIEPLKNELELTDPSHVAFADESQYNTGRYRGLGTVSLKHSDLHWVEAELRQLLSESGISEFKWKKMGGADKRFAAQKLLQYTVKQVNRSVLRVDVLTWDTHDSRHNIQGRDDLANLQRMYHHLLKNVMRERWPRNSTWLLCPDEHTAMPWQKMTDFLLKVDHKVSLTPSWLEPQRWVDLQRHFRILEMRDCDSRQTPLIQLADLLTGLAVYSRKEYKTYEKWLSVNDPQMNLLTPAEDLSLELSRTHQDRCPLLKEFDDLCKSSKLGVSLSGNQGLRTHNPKKPMNFWWYMPQHEADRAPVRAVSQKKKSNLLCEGN